MTKLRLLKDERTEIANQMAKAAYDKAFTDQNLNERLLRLGDFIYERLWDEDHARSLEVLAMARSMDESNFTMRDRMEWVTETVVERDGNSSVRREYNTILFYEQDEAGDITPSRRIIPNWAYRNHSSNIQNRFGLKDREMIDNEVKVKLELEDARRILEGKLNGSLNKIMSVEKLKDEWPEAYEVWEKRFLSNRAAGQQANLPATSITATRKLVEDFPDSLKVSA